MIKLYGIRHWSTVKKAFAWLEGNTITYEFHDYKKQGVPVDELRKWIARQGWESIINTKGATFRGLSDNQKKSFDKVNAIDLAIENPSLIKRPILCNEKTLLIGFKLAEYENAFKK
jgi:arsenate reductase